LRQTRTRDYTYGLIASVAGLSLFSYYVRDLLASLALFSLAFLLLALIVAATLLVWYATEQLAVWTGPASRNVVAFSRHLIDVYAKR
jgi:hypothetical protein